MTIVTSSYRLDSTLHSYLCWPVGHWRHIALRLSRRGFTFNRVPTGQGKLELVRQFEWSGKVRENAKVTGKSGKFGENFTFLYTCCNANNSRAGVQSTILLAVVVWLLCLTVTYLLKSLKFLSTRFSETGEGLVGPLCSARCCRISCDMQ